MSFNEERLQKAEMILSFTKQGFINRVREIAEALSICPVEDVKVIHNQLTKAIEALESAEWDVAFYKGECEAEKEKTR